MAKLLSKFFRFFHLVSVFPLYRCVLFSLTPVSLWRLIIYSWSEVISDLSWKSVYAYLCTASMSVSYITRTWSSLHARPSPCHDRVFSKKCLPICIFVLFHFLYSAVVHFSKLLDEFFGRYQMAIFFQFQYVAIDGGVSGWTDIFHVAIKPSRRHALTMYSKWATNFRPKL